VFADGSAGRARRRLLSNDGVIAFFEVFRFLIASLNNEV
jgi:hypothetical protein